MLLPVCLRYEIVVSVLQSPLDTPSTLVQAVSFACDLFWRTSCTLQNNHRAAPRSQICFCHLLLLTYILCIEKGREKTWDFLSPSDIRSERELHFNSFHSLILENLFHSISFSFRLMRLMLTSDLRDKGAQVPQLSSPNWSSLFAIEQACVMHCRDFDSLYQTSFWLILLASSLLEWIRSWEC